MRSTLKRYQILIILISVGYLSGCMGQVVMGRYLQPDRYVEVSEDLIQKIITPAISCGFTDVDRTKKHLGNYTQYFFAKTPSKDEYFGISLRQNVELNELVIIEQDAERVSYQGFTSKQLDQLGCFESKLNLELPDQFKLRLE